MRSANIVAFVFRIYFSFLHLSELDCKIYIDIDPDHIFCNQRYWFSLRLPFIIFNKKNSFSMHPNSIYRRIEVVLYIYIYIDDLLDR